MGTSKQDRQGARTAEQLERKYDWGKTFAEVYGLIDDAQDDAANALEAVKGLDASLDAEGVFNRLTDNGRVQGIYRDASDNIYINASYIKSGTLSADRIDAANLKVTAANITGSLSANQFTMGGQMAVYQDIGSSNLAGYFGYMDVQMSTSDGGGFNGKGMGVVCDSSGSHAMLLAPFGNIAVAGYGDVYVGSSVGSVNLSGTDLRFNGESIYHLLEAIKLLLGITVT